jgi:hypothetical protein
MKTSLVAKPTTVSRSGDAQNCFEIIAVLLFVPPLVTTALTALQISVVPLAVIVKLHRWHQTVTACSAVTRIDIHVLTPQALRAVIFKAGVPEYNQPTVAALKVFDCPLEVAASN